jgi:8-oxo-dGTP pyrophosphatase MutT (NUDIX family)
MPISEYLRNLRAKVGSALLLVPSVTGLIFDRHNRLLLLRHANGDLWAAPGGAIDPGEAPQDAVVREVWEETGLLVTPVQLCGVFSGAEFRIGYANGDEVLYVMAVFECREIGGTLTADGEETLEARYVDAADLDTLALPPWARLLLPRFMGGERRSWIPPVAWRPPSET